MTTAISNPPAPDFGLGKNLGKAILDGYDDVQNIVHLLRALQLALAGADDIELDDKYALEELTSAAERIGHDLIERMNRANGADLRAMNGGGSK